MQCTNGLGGQSLSTGRNDVGAPSRRGFRPPTRNHTISYSPATTSHPSQEVFVGSLSHSFKTKPLSRAHCEPLNTCPPQSLKPTGWEPKVQSKTILPICNLPMYKIRKKKISLAFPLFFSGQVNLILPDAHFNFSFSLIFSWDTSSHIKICRAKCLSSHSGPRTCSPPRGKLAPYVSFQK